MNVETVDVFHFMGVVHLVIQHDGIKYLALRPIVSQIGLDWRRQKQACFSEEGVILYGAMTVSASKTAEKLSISSPKNNDFIRLDRIYFYLARISVSRVRANGNDKAAEFLLSLQLEWAQALHEYETKGLATKSQHAMRQEQLRKDRLAIAAVVKAKGSTSNNGERRVLTSLIKSMAVDLGVPVDGDLFDEDNNGHLGGTAAA